MSELALQRIAENKIRYQRGEDARVLDLGNCGMTEVPEEIGALVWLEELDLSSHATELWDNDPGHGNGDTPEIMHPGDHKKKNFIQRFPAQIGNLQKLKAIRYQNETTISVVTGTGIGGIRNACLIDAIPFNSLIHLQEIKGLESIIIVNSQIDDLSWLAGLVHLHQLHLGSCLVSDMTPVLSLKGLTDILVT